MKGAAISPRTFVIIMILIGVWCIGSGMYGLLRPAQDLASAFTSCERGERYKGTPAYSSHCYSSTMNLVLILPTGNEYYYLISRENDPTMLVVRTARKYNKLTDLTQIDGVIRRLDFDDRQDLYEKLQNGSTVVSADYFLDAAAPMLYGLRILAGAVLLALIALGAYAVRSTKQVSKAFGMTMLGLILGEFYLIMYLLSMA